MFKKKTYKINEEDLRKLLYDSFLLEMLEEGGVDNWVHYGENHDNFIANVLGISEIEVYERDFGIKNIVDKEIKKYKRR